MKLHDLGQRTQATVFEDFLDHAPAALAMFDREMRYLLVSRRWRSDYGLGDRDLRGVRHYDVFPEIGDEWKRVHERALAGEVLKAEAERFVRQDGTALCLRWEVRPWRDETGAIGGIMIFTEDVTDVTRALNEAREMTQWFQLAQAAAGAGTWQWHLGTNQNVWSDELWRLYGLEKGSRIPSFEAWSDVIIPEDREAARRIVTEAAAERRDICLEFRVRWPDGALHHLLARGALSKGATEGADGYLGIVLDVTDSRRSEELARQARQERALRELAERSDERYRQLLEAAPDAMVVMSEDLRIELVNMQVESLFAYPRAELVGASMDILIPERLRSEHRAQVQDFLRMRPTRPMAVGREFLARRRDGTEISVEVSLGVIRSDDGLMVTAAIRDISDRKRAEAAAKLASDQLRAAVEELRTAHRAAEAGSAAKTEFVSSMSHELRTPLNAVLGFARLLQQDRKEPLSARHKERIDQIVRGGQHLLLLVEDVLDLSHLESGTVSVVLDTVDVLDVLREVKAALEPTAERHGVHIQVGPVESAVPLAAVDRTRFAQIITNFGTNAIKYNRPGGNVVLGVEQPRPGWIRAAVRDDGPGIPEDKQHLLFQPFQRIGQEMGPIPGTGIGLAITRRLARLMGGDVGVHSVAGGGSEFWVDVPVARQPRS